MLCWKHTRYKVWRFSSWPFTLLLTSHSTTHITQLTFHNSYSTTQNPHSTYHLRLHFTLRYIHVASTTSLITLCPANGSQLIFLRQLTNNSTTYFLMSSDMGSVKAQRRDRLSTAASMQFPYTTVSLPSFHVCYISAGSLLI